MYLLLYDFVIRFDNEKFVVFVVDFHLRFEAPLHSKKTRVFNADF
jgi:hypothetical protein